MSLPRFPPPVAAAPPSAPPDRPTFPCPRCGAPLDPVDVDPVDLLVTCRCGQRAYCGYVAEAAAINARLDWLRARIASGEPAPAPEIAHRYAIWAPPVSPAAAPTARAEIGAQTLLLTLGAVLVISAAIVFAAVMWRHLGVAGQVLLFAGLTLAVGALATWLQPRLIRTAESLGAVAFGLLVVDAVAAPALGLLPKDWVVPAHPYFVVAAAVGAVASLVAGHLSGLRSWVWLGWSTVAVTCGLLAWTLGEWSDGSRSHRAAAMTVLTVAGVALLARSWSTEPDARPIRLAGAASLAAGAAIVLVLAMNERGLHGGLFTVAVTTGATALAWRSRRQSALAVSTLAGVGATVGLAFLVPADRQPVWFGVIVGLVGSILLIGIAVRIRPAALGLATAGATWGTWIVGRLSRIHGGPTVDPLGELVRRQIAGLLLVAATAGFVAAWRRLGDERAALLAWPAALIGEAGLALADPAWAPHLLESVTLPFAGLLLLAGWLSTRSEHAASLVRYAPVLAIGLVPSAVATWGAAWVGSGRTSSGGTTADLVRLVSVLLVGASLVVVGAWRRLAGVLVPAAAAVAVAAGAQLWTGIVALPRWVALATVGVVLVGAGARLEWLFREGRRARAWFHALS